jgi:hypothetical protein
MKSAVELLRVELILNSKYRETLNGKVSFTIGLSKFDEIINQAKEMEKQQIVDAYSNGRVDEQFKGTGASFYITKSEQYYNETFKNNG